LVAEPAASAETGVLPRLIWLNLLNLRPSGHEDRESSLRTVVVVVVC
jgi:hypothetical protein